MYYFIIKGDVAPKHKRASYSLINNDLAKYLKKKILKRRVVRYQKGSMQKYFNAIKLNFD